MILYVGRPCALAVRMKWTAQHLDHAAARKPCYVSDLGQRKRYDGQNHVAPRALAETAGGQPAQIHGEQQDQQRRHDEVGYGDTRHRKGHDRVISARILPQCREAASRDTKQQRDDHRAAAEPQRDREARHDELGDREVPVLKRRSEVCAREVTQVARELHWQRLVEVIRRAQIRLDLGQKRALGIERPARREADHEERERDQYEQRRYRAETAAQAITEQRLAYCLKCEWRNVRALVAQDIEVLATVVVHDIRFVTTQPWLHELARDVVVNR